MASKIDLGGHVIIFSDPDDYQQCVSQIPDHVIKVKPKLYFYNTLVHSIPPEYKMTTKRFYYIPYNKYSGVFSKQWDNDNVLRALSIMNPNVPYVRISQFGYSMPPIAPLAEYGRNFPNGKGMQIPDSWEQNIKNTWGNDATTSSTVGSVFGPGKNADALSATYFHGPRMSIPGGPLETYMMLNSRCNQSKASDPMLVPGQFPESTNFGKRRTKRRVRFGTNGLYGQMGPAYGGSNKITSYGGGTQVDEVFPSMNKSTWVGGATKYDPLSRNIMNK